MISEDHDKNTQVIALSRLSKKKKRFAVLFFLPSGCVNSLLTNLTSMITGKIKICSPVG